jgi:hypothetical protein
MILTTTEGPNMTATLTYTSSREANTVRTMRGIARAGAAQDKRKAEWERHQARAAEARAEGQLLDPNGLGEFCLICSRATDHSGEHSPEQIAAWRAAGRAR